jgi:hypothetical protein
MGDLESMAHIRMARDAYYESGALAFDPEAIVLFTGKRRREERAMTSPAG